MKENALIELKSAFGESYAAAINNVVDRAKEILEALGKFCDDICSTIARAVEEIRKYFVKENRKSMMRYMMKQHIPISIILSSNSMKTPGLWIVSR